MENFVLELYRTLSSNNGSMPPKLQHKLQELVNQKPIIKKSFEGRKTVKDGENEENEDDNNEVEWKVFRDALKVVAHDLNTKIIDVSTVIKTTILIQNSGFKTSTRE